jgi:hypothetical protein
MDIDGYLVISPSQHQRGTPQIVAFRHSHGAADSAAAHMERTEAPGTFPIGLIVVPCTVTFILPNVASDLSRPSVDATSTQDAMGRD